MAKKSVEAPEFIREIMALGSTHAERAKVLDVHLNTISTMARTGKIPECMGRYLRFPNIIAALHRDALALQAKSKTEAAP